MLKGPGGSGWKSRIGKQHHPEVCERSFALVLDRGGMRRTWRRGRANVHARYLPHVAGYDLGAIMRALTRHGPPREAAASPHAAGQGTVLTPVVSVRG